MRELKNVVHRAFIMADEEITPRCLPREVGGDSGFRRSLHFQVGTSIEEVERRLIMATLEAYGGNKRKTADILGVSLKTLYKSPEPATGWRFRRALHGPEIVKSSTRRHSTPL